MRVNKSRYGFIHGKQPRGYGMWVFHLETLNDFEVFQFTGLFTEACTQAKKAAKIIGAFEVTVQG
jgi:hypothetical protein